MPSPASYCVVFRAKLHGLLTFHTRAPCTPAPIAPFKKAYLIPEGSRPHRGNVVGVEVVALVSTVQLSYGEQDHGLAQTQGHAGLDSKKPI